MVPCTGGQVIRKPLTDLAEALDQLDAFMADLPLDQAIDDRTAPPEVQAKKKQLCQKVQALLDAIDFGLPDDPAEAFFYRIQMIRYYEHALPAQPTVGAAKEVADIILDTVKHCQNDYQGTLVEKNAPAFAFIADRCKVVLDWKGKASDPAPNWSDVVQSPFWEFPPIDRGFFARIPWKLVLGVLGAAAVAGFLLSHKPAPAAEQGAA